MCKKTCPLSVSNIKNGRRSFQFRFFNERKPEKVHMGLIEDKMLPQTIPFSCQLQRTGTLVFTLNWCTGLCWELSLMSDCTASAQACLARSVLQCCMCTTLYVRCLAVRQSYHHAHLAQTFKGMDSCLVIVLSTCLFVGFYELQEFRKDFRLAGGETIKMTHSQQPSYTGHGRTVVPVPVSFTTAGFSFWNPGNIQWRRYFALYKKHGIKEQQTGEEANIPKISAQESQRIRVPCSSIVCSRKWIFMSQMLC